MEGITRGVSIRTVQADIQIMRSDRLGFNAPIEVYNNKFYRYEDPDYSISESPFNDETCELVLKAVNLIKQKQCNNLDEIGEVLGQVGKKLNTLLLN